MREGATHIFNFYLPTPALSGSGAHRSASAEILRFKSQIQLNTFQMGIFSACFRVRNRWCIEYPKQGTPYDSTKVIICLSDRLYIYEYSFPLFILLIRQILPMFIIFLGLT